MSKLLMTLSDGLTEQIDELVTMMEAPNEATVISYAISLAYDTMKEMGDKSFMDIKLYHPRYLLKKE